MYFPIEILLMEDILHHLECINLVNSGINYLRIGAGFLPSTVVPQGRHSLVLWCQPWYGLKMNFEGMNFNLKNLSDHRIPCIYLKVKIEIDGTDTKRLVKGSYKSICRDCAIYFSTTV